MSDISRLKGKKRIKLNDIIDEFPYWQIQKACHLALARRKGKTGWGLSSSQCKERYPFIIKPWNVPKVKINTIIVGGGEMGEKRLGNPSEISFKKFTDWVDSKYEKAFINFHSYLWLCT